MWKSSFGDLEQIASGVRVIKAVAVHLGMDMAVYLVLHLSPHLAVGFAMCLGLDLALSVVVIGPVDMEWFGYEGDYYA